MRIKIDHLMLLAVSLSLIPDDSLAWNINVNRLFRNAFRHVPRPRIPPTTPIPCEPTYAYDPTINWCSGTYCDESGDLIYWDNFNCRSTTTPTTTPTPTPTTNTPPAPPPTTTTPAPTPPSTTPQPPGCMYEGRFYPPGLIERGEDRASNWCWVVYCSESGHIQHGDDFNCFPTSTRPTTAPPPPPSPTTPA